MTPRNAFPIAAAVCLAAAASAQSTYFEGTGPSAKSAFGAAVAGLGDVDADGFIDLAVGAPLDDSFATDAGLAQVLSGFDGGALYTFLGTKAYDHFGQSLAPVGDLDGDGFADFAVGAPAAHAGGLVDAGLLQIFSGADGAVLAQLGGAAAYDNFAFALASLGDLDGDGAQELLVGIPGDDSAGNAAGRATLFDLRTLTARRSFLGGAPGDRFGSALARVPDVDQDGLADLVVGAPQADPNGSSSGLAMLYSSLTGLAVHTFYGDASAEKNGASVAGLADVDGDGFGEVAVGAPFARNGGTARFGRVRLFSGRDGNVLHTWYGEGQDDRFGWALAGSGDVDGDGQDDLLIGAPHDDDDGSRAGSVYVISGAGGHVIATIHGGEAGAELGTALDSVGSLDADPRPELLAGAPAADAARGFARLYSALDAPAASVAPVGAGCGSPAPVLAAGGTPLLGGTFTLLLDSATPGSTALFAYSRGTLDTPLSLAGGCDLYLDPSGFFELGAAVVGGPGKLARTIALPGLPTLAGATFTAQSIVAPTAGALGFDLTNALELSLGY